MKIRMSKSTIWDLGCILWNLTFSLTFSNTKAITENDHSTGSAPMNYSAIVVFGDSYSDNGHYRLKEFQHSLSDPPANGGRYCDGPVWDEFLTESLSVDYKVTLLNYAFNGAHINNALTTNLPPKVVPDTASQIQIYLEDLNDYLNQAPPPQIALNKILHVLWIGINPLLTIWRAIPKTRWISSRRSIIRDINRNIDLQIHDLEQQIIALTANTSTAGFPSDYVILTVPPLETTLLIQREAQKRGGNNQTLIIAYVDVMSQMTNYFNKRLLEVTSPLINAGDENHGFAVFDSQSFWKEVESKPQQYGIDTRSACFPDLDKPPCQQPDHYQYWDTLHPSTTFHAHLSEALHQFLGQFDE